MKIIVRYERDNPTSRNPCYYRTFEIKDCECHIMIEIDYRERLNILINIENIKKRNIQKIITENFNKLNYNGIRQYLLNTVYINLIFEDNFEIQYKYKLSLYEKFPFVIPDPIDDQLAVMHIRTLIDSLPEREKEVLVRHCLEGYTLREIAKAQGVSQPMISRILKRARARLAEKLNR